MQDALGSPVMPDMLTVLREATGPSHERLDASFGALDLMTRDGLGRFLAAHAAGLEPMFPAFRGFLESELGLECPDYPAMLRADLDALGVDAVPSIETPAGLDAAGGEAGIAYVVSGSRLGLVVIRQRGYWGEAKGFRSAYMSDGRGHDAWKALVPVLRTRTYAPDQAEALRTAALAAFETFSRAFAASAGLAARVDG
ncbi:biliverdin-producing heme oxygenase [Sphingomonas sp. LH128]|uniref:biliverdin-producing heme oxygenase n=1 Tax=Sphingomonas sp. LH128 TaxID=473781 RepID=UPI00155E8B6A|nr:biliverdin-producing heme oxygenase [Sphingomonas sp. LH128]